jgi:DNA-binding CsgD family transcriptional regulator
MEDSVRYLDNLTLDFRTNVLYTELNGLYEEKADEKRVAMNKDWRALAGNPTQTKAQGENETYVDERVSAPLLIARMSGGHISNLTRRELQVLELLAEGLSNKEIARALIITTHTVKAHITRILYKLGADSRTEAAVLWATRAER